MTISYDYSENEEKKLFIGELCHDILPEQSKWRVSKKKIILSLRKKDPEANWWNIIDNR